MQQLMKAYLWGWMLAVGAFAFGLPAHAEVCGAQKAQAELPLSGCNRGFSIHVTALERRAEYGGTVAPDGHEWLVVTAKFDNWIGVDLLYRTDYKEPLLVGSLTRQLYLMVDNQRVVRPKVLAEQGQQDSFVLPMIGSSHTAEMGYLVPTDCNSLLLSYHHEDFADIYLPLQGAWSGFVDLSGDAPRQANDVMQLAVTDYQLLDAYQGIAAAPEQQWLIVDLMGKSEWTVTIPRLAVANVAESGQTSELTRVMEYVGADIMLQAVVDGEFGYYFDGQHSELGATPALLPHAWTGGALVYQVPKRFSSLELVAYFGDFIAPGIDPIRREAMRFTLQEQDEPPATQPLMSIQDQPLSVDVLALTPLTTERTQWALDIRMHNHGSDGGMMQALSRFSLITADGSSHKAQQLQQQQQPLREPFYLPPSDSRRMTLIFSLPDPATPTHLDYAGVAGNYRQAIGETKQ
jgi:hypothetical protein